MNPLYLLIVCGLASSASAGGNFAWRQTPIPVCPSGCGKPPNVKSTLFCMKLSTEGKAPRSKCDKLPMPDADTRECVVTPCYHFAWALEAPKQCKSKCGHDAHTRKGRVVCKNKYTQVEGKAKICKKLLIKKPKRPVLHCPATTPCERTCDATSVRERKEWKQLKNTEQKLYINALIDMKTAPAPEGSSASNLYDHFVNVHVSPGWTAAHFHGGFLPWHRQYLFEFESALRGVKPKYSCVTLPYWDWSVDAGVAIPEIVTALSDMKHFSGLPRQISLPTTEGNSEHLLDSDVNSGFIYGPAVLRSIIELNADHDDFRRQLEYPPHATVHILMGGIMSGTASPSDPLFWSHHAFVDKLWKMHQDCHLFDVTPETVDKVITANQYVGRSTTHQSFDDAMLGLTGSPRSVWNQPLVEYSMNEADNAFDDLLEFCEMNREPAPEDENSGRRALTPSAMSHWTAELAKIKSESGSNGLVEDLQLQDVVAWECATARPLRPSREQLTTFGMPQAMIPQALAVDLCPAPTRRLLRGN